MKNISINCCKCFALIYVEFNRDTPVGISVTCLNCGAAQSVTGGLVEGKDEPEYWGEQIGE